MMQIRLSPSMGSITISTSNNGFLDLAKVKVAARHVSYRTLFHTVLVLAFLLPFVFILTAVVTLEGVNNCSSFVCYGRRLGPRFLGRGGDDSMRLLRDLYKLIDQANSLEIPVGLKFPETFSEFLSEMKHNQYDAKTFAIMLKGTMENREREVKKSRLAEQLHKHFAATSIPKGLHCLSLRLTDEYSSNAHARKRLPPLEFCHFSPIIHTITSLKTFLCFEAIESHNGVRSHYHGNPVLGTNASDNPRVFASKLQARSPKYISLLNHLRIYLPELFPNLSKVVFLDDDVVVQRDLIPLWNIDLSGKVNGAVETCEGEDGWVGGESSDGQLAIVDASMDEGRSMEQADGVNCNANGRPIRECCKCGSLELEGSTVWWWIEQENST
ncbi:hypothetical protein HPP92_010161 [Vanilla planifolia]|uniref:Hexosyltransferase n=2 Tax=Vanilla planifolia TaxID=51239 RepID=A0A835UZF5_VANPL|nr:hypothetical protein HPP92_010161 [Vanilla planifolia]